MSAPAAFAAVAAQGQGKFWQYHDLIFADYKTLTNEKLIGFAKQLQLNMPLFKQDMNSTNTKKTVSIDYRDGREAGVTSTPALFINGRRVRDRSIDAIDKIINEELK